MAHLILYADADFKGKPKDVYGDVLFLADFNDITSSFIIREGQWEFFIDANFQGQAGPSTLGPGSYRWVADWGIPNDAISSVKLVQG